MKLRFLGIYPNTPDDGSPTIWLDEDTGDLVIQSYKADPATLRHCREVGSVPGHTTDVPEHETVIRLPANMLQFSLGPVARYPLTAVREALSSAKRSAVHLEMRDSYMLDDPGFLAWQRGERSDPNDRASWWRPWLDVVAEATRRGIVMRRARIISEPISPYIRYEYDGTFTNIAAGEQVRWLPRRRTADLLLPGVDFWAFDDELVIFNHFTGDGQWADPAMELCRDPDVAKRCAMAFEAIWDRAVPHDQYRPD